MLRCEICRSGAMANDCVPPVGGFRPAVIGVQEMSSRPQHAHHLGEKTNEVGILVRGFDIDHRIERFIGKRQVLGVALDEIQAGHIVALSAHFDAGRVQIQSRVGGGAQGARDVRGSPAGSATDLQHLFAGEIHLGGRDVVELDAVPVGLVGASNGRAIGGSSS